MIQFKNFNYNNKKVTALATDDSNGRFLWMAFAQDSNGNCLLRKVSAHKPDQTYFNVELAVDSIDRLKIKDGFIYLAVNHSTIMGYKLSLVNPIGLQTSIDIPVGVNENPVDIAVGASNLYYLFPGSSSGEVSKVVKITTAGVVEETIELQQSGDIVKFATGIVVDANGDLRISTFTDPATCVRVYQISGGIYVFQIYLIDAS